MQMPSGFGRKREFQLLRLLEFPTSPPDRLGATQVKRFQWYLLQERKLAPGTVEMRISALRFFFKKMLKRRDMHFDDLPFPKTPRKLPTVLSPEEVRRMIEGTTIARY